MKNENFKRIIYATTFSLISSIYASEIFHLNELKDLAEKYGQQEKSIPAINRNKCKLPSPTLQGQHIVMALCRSNLLTKEEAQGELKYLLMEELTHRVQQEIQRLNKFTLITIQQ